MFQIFPSLLATKSGTSTTGVAANLLTGLYAYYKMDEASGSAIDASVNARNIPNFANAIGTTSGKINTSRLWPATQAYFYGGASTNFQPGTQHLSFSLWINFVSTGYAGGSGDVGLLTKTGTADNKEYIFWYASGSAVFKFMFFVSADGLTTTTLQWPTSPVAGVWYHCAGGWDGTNIWITINAAPRLTAAFAGPIFIGNTGFQMGFESGSSAFLNGSMDEVGIWIGRDLTDADIALLYNSGNGLPFSSF